MINQAYEQMGPTVTQQLAAWFAGIARHTWKGSQVAEEHGWREAVARRDRPDDGDGLH